MRRSRCDQLVLVPKDCERRHETDANAKRKPKRLLKNCVRVQPRPHVSEYFECVLFSCRFKLKNIPSNRIRKGADSSANLSDPGGRGLNHENS